MGREPPHRAGALSPHPPPHYSRRGVRSGQDFAQVIARHQPPRGARGMQAHGNAEVPGPQRGAQDMKNIGHYLQHGIRSQAVGIF